MATTDQGEHTFDVEVLVSGEELRGYSAGEDLTTGEPVGISGDTEVSGSAADGGDFIGVNLYDVASGEEAAIAGDEIVPDGLGTFETVASSGASAGVAIVQDGAASGELCEAYIFAVQGATA